MSGFAKLLKEEIKKESIAISLKTDKKQLEEFDKFCTEHGKSRSAVLNLFIRNAEDIFNENLKEEKGVQCE